MTDTVIAERFSLLSQGSTFSFKLAPGQSLAVLGPAGSGKSRFVRCLAGDERPGQGTLHVEGPLAVAGKDGFSKRSNPQSILRHAIGGRKSAYVAEALSATNLWDLRQTRISDLTSGQLTACELLSCLGTEVRLMMMDGHLDRLDPWTLNGVLALLRKRLARGAAIVAVTNRPDLLTHFDSALILDGRKASFAGAVDSLLKSGPKCEIQVESKTQAGVRSIVEPFQVSVTEEDSRLYFRAGEGQELAAKLLLEGYGDVRFVVLRQPTPEQALIQLMKPSTGPRKITPA